MLKISNSYRNVDVRNGFSKRYCHVRGDRLGQLCDKIGIKYAKALIGFNGKKRYGYSPVFDGVVISSRSKAKLLKAIEERSKRASDPKRIAANEKSAQRRMEKKAQEEMALRKQGIRPDSMTAKWLKRGEVDEWAARLIAFKARYRHEHTDYEACLQAEREMGTPWEDRQLEARSRAIEEPIPSTWQVYLEKYGFHDEISRRLAAVLQDPSYCHPIWFMKAKLAVEKNQPVELTYEGIRELIAETFFDTLGHD